MGGDAGFGHMVHVLGADLKLHRRAVGPDQRRVQGLVAVDFGNRDVVLELARHGLVETVQRTQRQITLRRCVDHDAKAIDVEHLRKRKPLVGHFSVDAIHGLLAPLHFGAQLCIR